MKAFQIFFQFDITLVSEQSKLDLDALLQSKATFRIWTRDHLRNTPYHGMLSTIEQLGKVDQYVFYKVTLVPRLWILRLNTINEVYLEEKTFRTLLPRILERHGLTHPHVNFMIKTPTLYRERSFTCQYQETDLAFISRWMEQEGLYYFFSPRYRVQHRRNAGHYGLQRSASGPGTGNYATPPENVQTDRQDTCVTSFTCQKHIFKVLARL